MKAKRIPIMAIMAAAILVIPIGISAFQQQQASAIIIVDSKEFKKMTHEFEKAVINALGGPDTTPADLRVILDTYVQEVMRLQPPDPVLLRLLEDYQHEVMMIFEQPPPDDGKAHEQIKTFKQLTRELVKGVLCGIQPCT